MAAAMGGGRSVELIDREQDLAPVLDDWRRLAVARGNAFVTPEWYLLALRTLERDAVPLVAVARGDGGTVRGLLPLIAVESTRRSRIIAFAGARQGDVFHPVAEQGEEAELAEAMAPAVAERIGLNCHLDLGRVESGARWWRGLAAAWPIRTAVVAQPADVHPFITLAGSDWDQYLATRSAQFRSQLGRKMRALRREHDVRMRRSRMADEVISDTGALFALHAARWEEQPSVSALADLRVRDFLSEFALAAHDRGWLRLYLLEIDGTAVAAWYGWRVGDRFSYYQAGFDSAWARYSVGFLLLAETVRAAFDEGASEYDMLLGDEAFKSRFATGKRHARTVLVAPPASRARWTAEVKAIARSGVRAMPESARQRVRALRGRIEG